MEPMLVRALLKGPPPPAPPAGRACDPASAGLVGSGVLQNATMGLGRSSVPTRGGGTCNDTVGVLAASFFSSG